MWASGPLSGFAGAGRFDLTFDSPPPLLLQFVRVAGEKTNPFLTGKPKVATLSSAESTPFSAAIQCHPSMLSVDDAKKATVPQLVLPSKDEPKDAVAGWKTALETHATPVVAEKSSVQIFETMHHGWMGARANLEEEENRVEYEKGYRKVVHFLKEVL